MAKPNEKQTPPPANAAAAAANAPQGESQTPPDAKALETVVVPPIKMVSFTDAVLTTRLDDAAVQATEYSAAIGKNEVFTRSSQIAFKIAFFNWVSDMYAVSDEAYAAGFVHAMSTPTWFPANPSQAAQALGWRKPAATATAATAAVAYVAKRKTVA